MEQPCEFRPSVGEIYRARLAVLAASLGVVVASVAMQPAQAEWRVSLYGGKSVTFDSDVHFKQPGGTDMTLHDVPWDDESFKSPFYYGARITYWFDESPWGLAIDFTHAKIIADTSAVVSVSGTRNGTPVSGNQPVNNTFSNLQLSHGHNLLTANGLYRLRWDAWEPYAGLGVGVAIPHVEADVVGGQQTQEYQIGGPAAQGFLGLSVRVWDRLSVFSEYKLSYADVKADLNGGGTFEVKPITNHFVFGISVRIY